MTTSHTLGCEMCNLTFTNELEHQEHLKIHINKLKEISFITVRDGACDHNSSETETTYSTVIDTFFSNSKIVDACDETTGAILEKEEPVKSLKEKIRENLSEVLSRPAGKRKRRQRRKLFQDESELRCTICNTIFARKYHLDRHLRLTSCSGRTFPLFKCEVCGKSYTRKDNLKVHFRSHTGEPRPQRKLKFKCDYCPKMFHGMSNLRVHERKHTGEKPYHCDFCEKSFPTPVRLNRHLLVHTGEKPYTCLECGKRFCHKSALKLHVVLHKEGAKPYKCKYCDKEFVQQINMNAHMFHHTGENGFQCQECGRAFNRKAVLQKHVENIHRKQKPFECSDCEKCWKTQESLDRHMLSHLTEKLHQCSSKHQYQLHLSTHTRGEPMQCDECGKSFKRKDLLECHRKAFHSEEEEIILPD